MAFADRTIGTIVIACEADSQPRDAQVGVGACLFNRLRLGRYGESVAAVCLKRIQFSEFNDDKANNANLMRVAVMGTNHPAVISAAAAYDAAASGEDPVDGATHFYADGIDPPNWSLPPAVLARKIGKLNFFKNVP